MRYRVEVWRHGDPSSIYEDNDINALVQVYKEDWGAEEGECTIYVYEDGRELSVEEEHALGFYD